MITSKSAVRCNESVIAEMVSVHFFVVSIGVTVGVSARRKLTVQIPNFKQQEKNIDFQTKEQTN